MHDAPTALLRLSAEDLAQRCRRLRWLLLDVDGVLTDGRLTYHADGSVAKAFHTKDGLGIRLAKLAGLRVGTLSLRDDPALRFRAAELSLDAVIAGGEPRLPGGPRRDKGETLDGFLAEHNLAADEVAFVGDDLPDLPALRRAGLAAAPADAAAEVREEVHIVLGTPGGHGAVRELIEIVLVARGAWEQVLVAITGS